MKQKLMIGDEVLVKLQVTEIVLTDDDEIEYKFACQGGWFTAAEGDIEITDRLDERLGGHAVVIIG